MDNQKEVLKENLHTPIYKKMEDIALKWEKLKKGYFGIVFHFMEAEHINLQWGPDPTGQWSSIVFSSAVLRWEFIKEHKKERKKERKHAVDQEPTKKSIKKKRKFFIFSWPLSWSRACFLSFFLDRLLGRKRVFLFSYFFFFYKFPPLTKRPCFRGRYLKGPAHSKNENENLILL